MTLSIVVVFHNMVREVPRTLQSLSPGYQRNLLDPAYEVIAIDNGSDQALDADAVTSTGPRVRYVRRETTSRSPAAAVNLGVRMAEGDLVALIVDGARMASPGLVGQTQRAASLVEHPFVLARSWHLGPDVQNESMLDGYDADAEDRLLEDIDWPTGGYALFTISTLAQSSRPGFGGAVPSECSWWAMRPRDFEHLGGFDERFQSPGGGLVNHAFRDRVIDHPDLVPIELLGEGVFHQFHGGVATNVPRSEHPLDTFLAEYERIHGVPYAKTPTTAPRPFGDVGLEARRFVAATTGT